MKNTAIVMHVQEVGSTNDFLRHYQGEEGSAMTVVVAHSQTAGRGQGGNHWESEPGMNLTMSIKCRPQQLPAARQFVMLEAGALAVAETLDDFVEGITVKWPNDVYWHDRKMSGTLSECTVSGSRVGYCILGIGLNVNQTVFRSDAPNPVSLNQVIGGDIDREAVLNMLVQRFGYYLERVNGGDDAWIHRRYQERLYRREGLHPYADADGRFMATLHHIEPNGHLVLSREDGSQSTYAFKEVAFLPEDETETR